MFSRQIFRRGAKQISKVGFKAWLHNKRLCKFRDDPLRDGWDPLSRSLGSKPIKKEIVRKNISRSRLPRRAANKYVLVHTWTKFAAVSSVCFHFEGNMYQF